jgi:hypothetical protein
MLCVVTSSRDDRLIPRPVVGAWIIVGGLCVVLAWALWISNPGDDPDRGLAGVTFVLCLALWVLGVVVGVVWAAMRRRS